MAKESEFIAVMVPYRIEKVESGGSIPHVEIDEDEQLSIQALTVLSSNIWPGCDPSDIRVGPASSLYGIRLTNTKL